MDAMKRNMANRLWLDYFNRTLFDAGLITELERNLLYHKIERRYQTERPVKQGAQIPEQPRP